jgi:hypothetical protein
MSRSRVIPLVAVAAVLAGLLAAVGLYGVPELGLLLHPERTATPDAHDDAATDAESDELPTGPWWQWAADLGFDVTATVPPAADAEAVQQAIDALSDDDLASLDDGLGSDEAPIMRLASWLWAAASAEQVHRLHARVPTLEPERGSGAAAHGEWMATTVDLDVTPGMADIHQGRADDCWLLAGLGAVAITDSDGLIERARANANGTTTVTWTIGGVDIPITVSPYLPVDGDELRYAHADDADEANWSSMFEKAYAALPRFGSYARIAGGSMLADSPTTVAAAMAAVLGSPSTTQPARSVTLDDIRDAVDAGLPVTATTFITELAPEPGADEVGMVDRHVYVVERVDGDEIVLHNPWGYTTSTGPEVVRLTIEQLNRRVLLMTFGGG